jgi:YHS domain-containing protein
MGDQMPRLAERFPETLQPHRHLMGMRIPVLILTVVLGAGAVSADGRVKQVNSDSAGLALHGYDPVAYFTDGMPVEGSSQFEYQWNGATWRFASAASRDRFSQAPQAYAPQFGGYCAWAVSRNYTADIDPQAFDIVNGKLYLNYSKLVQLRWKVDREGNIRKADQNWPKLTQPAKGAK